MPETAPAPFLIPQNTLGGSLQEQSRCNRTRDAIGDFLRSGEEIGEPDLFYTAAVMAPYLRFYLKTARKLRSHAISMVSSGQFHENDPILDELDDLNDLAEFYMDVLSEASQGTPDVQRDLLYRFVISPMFFGEGYEVFFDDETPIVEITPTYCWPTRIAAKMEVAVNEYDHFWRQVGDFTSWAGWGLYDVTIDPLSDKIAEEMHEALPYNEAVVVIREHLDPVIEDAKQARDAVLGAAETVGKAAAKTVRMWPWILGAGILGWGAYTYFTSRKKR